MGSGEVEESWNQNYLDITFACQVVKESNLERCPLVSHKNYLDSRAFPHKTHFGHIP